MRMRWRHAERAMQASSSEVCVYHTMLFQTDQNLDAVYTIGCMGGRVGIMSGHDAGLSSM